MEVTIEITQYCEEDCWFCSSKASKSGRDISVDRIQKFLDSFEEGTIERINISGGEPLAHSEFYRILKWCENYCDDIRVYSNAIKHLMFNSHVLKEIKVEANVCLTPGEEVYIPKNVDKVHLLKLTGNGKTPSVQLSGCNCSDCNHSLLQADGKIVSAPCKKDYK